MKARAHPLWNSVWIRYAALLPFLSARTLRRGVLILVTLLTLLPVLVASYRSAVLYRDRVHRHYHERVDSVVVSSRCTAATGFFLVHCVDTHGFCAKHPHERKVVPIESLGMPDDRGKALLASGLTYAGLGPLDRTGLVRVNLALNILGVMALVLVLAHLGMEWLAVLVVLAASAVLGGSNDPLRLHALVRGPDHVAAYFGNSLMVLSALILLAQILARPRTVNRWPLVFVFAALATTVALRQAIGLAGVGAGLLMWGWTMRKPRWALVPVGIVLILSTQLTNMALLVRHLTVPGLPASNLMRDHGVSHPILLGLGCRADNPFGLRWLDQDGHRVARAVDSNVVINSERYSWILTGALGKTLLSHPIWAAQSYGGNLIDSVAVLFGKVPSVWDWLTLGTLLALFVAACRHASESWRIVLTGLGVGTAAVWASAGVFVCAKSLWLYPVRFALVTCLLASLGCLAEVHLRRRLPGE